MWFALRCAGVYGASFLAVWGAWRYGSPAKAAALVVATCLAGAVAAHWTGHLFDGGHNWRRWLEVLAWPEAAAAALLAWSGTTSVGTGWLLVATSVVGVTSSAFNTAVNPAAQAAARDRGANVDGEAVGGTAGGAAAGSAPGSNEGVQDTAALGIGFMFDGGKLVGTAFMGVVLFWPPAALLMAVAVVVGITRFCAAVADPPPGAQGGEAADEEPEGAGAEPGREGAPEAGRRPAGWRGVLAPLALSGVLALSLAQMALIYSAAASGPGAYTLLGVVWTLGAVASAWQQTRSGRLGGRGAISLAVVVFAASTYALVRVEGWALQALAALAYGWAVASSFQLSRAWLRRAAPGSVGRAGGSLAALTTISGALGAPLTAVALGSAGAFGVLVIASALAALVAVAMLPERELRGPATH